MRKLIKIFLVIFILIIGGYLYLKFGLLKAKDFKPNESKAITPIDLRPSIIAKLQQLVKDGSNGLYRLDIGKLNPDVVASTVDISDATLTPDSAVLKQLDKTKLAPDDVFKIKVHGIHIDGFGIEDLLHTNKVDVNSIHITDPVIEVYHKLKPYNEAERKKNDSLSVYHRIMKQMKKISIGSIVIEHGKLIDHDLGHRNSTKRFEDVAISIKDILIDSSTQNDNNRFLFAKIADFACNDYALVTPDSSYDFKIERIIISGEKHSLIAEGVSIKPHGGKEHFEKKLTYRKEMYSASFPKIVLTGTDWWSLLHRDKFIAERADIDKGSFLIYLDNTPPSSPTINVANFPDQLMMAISRPVSVSKVYLKNVKLTYEEFEPKINQHGFAYFDNVEAVASNLTNMPQKIKLNKNAELAGTAQFMNKVKFTAKINFDLTKSRQGAFFAYVHMDSLDKTVLNPITEPMALFTFKSGTLKEGTATVTGDNMNAKGDVLVLYNNLNLTPLKQSKNDEGKLRKKVFTNFIANALLIKNNNPTGNQQARHPVFVTNRDHHGNFFNFIWTTILTGILKTVGIPVKLVVKEG